MGLSTDLQQPIRWQLSRQCLKVQTSLRRMGQWDYRAHTHTHSRDTTERAEVDICPCVFMHALLCVWEDQSIQELLVG